MIFRVAGLVDDSIVDGPGVRLTVFMQGCPHRCEGCQNPQTHDFAGGKEMDTEKVLARMRKNPLLSGLTLSGGEPFAQIDAALELARGAHALHKNVWVYSGYTYEQLAADERARALLDECDVLIDGPFLLAEKSLALKWRGSRNQRVIDLNATRREGRLVEMGE